MRGSWQRQTALTNNIANADTPGYRAPGRQLRVDAAERDGSGRSRRAGRQFEPRQRSRSKPAPNGDGISIDQESAQLAENGLDYQALTQVVGARNTIMRSAIGIL